MAQFRVGVTIFHDQLGEAQVGGAVALPAAGDGQRRGARAPRPRHRAPVVRARGRRLRRRPGAGRAARRSRGRPGWSGTRGRAPSAPCASPPRPSCRSPTSATLSIGGVRVRLPDERRPRHPPDGGRVRLACRGTDAGRTPPMNAGTAPDPRRWKALAVVCAAFFMTVLDVAIVNVALPSIATDLDFAAGGPAVGHHGLRHHLRRLPAARRPRRRPAGPPRGVPRRRDPVHGRVARLRPGHGRRDADRRRARCRASAPRSSRRRPCRSSPRPSPRARSATRRSASGARSAAAGPRPASSSAASSRSTSAGSGSSSSTCPSASPR